MQSFGELRVTGGDLRGPISLNGAPTITLQLNENAAGLIDRESSLKAFAKADDSLTVTVSCADNADASGVLPLARCMKGGAKGAPPKWVELHVGNDSNEAVGAVLLKAHWTALEAPAEPEPEPAADTAVAQQLPWFFSTRAFYDLGKGACRFVGGVPIVGYVARSGFGALDAAASASYGYWSKEQLDVAEALDKTIEEALASFDSNKVSFVVEKAVVTKDAAAATVLGAVHKVDGVRQGAVSVASSAVACAWDRASWVLGAVFPWGFAKRENKKDAAISKEMLEPPAAAPERSVR